MKWYKQNQVNIVPRDANLPNCPELRPIERYWALVKRRLKSTSRRVDDIKKFRTSWNNAAKGVSETTIKALMEGIPKKISRGKYPSPNTKFAFAVFFLDFCVLPNEEKIIRRSAKFTVIFVYFFKVRVFKTLEGYHRRCVESI